MFMGWNQWCIFLFLIFLHDLWFHSVSKDVVSFVNQSNQPFMLIFIGKRDSCVIFIAENLHYFRYLNPVVHCLINWFGHFKFRAIFLLHFDDFTQSVTDLNIDLVQHFVLKRSRLGSILFVSFLFLLLFAQLNVLSLFIFLNWVKFHFVL